MDFDDYDPDDATNFQSEISKMMYGFGDCPNPNPDTVLLIDSIVLQQLRSLLKEASQISIDRGKDNISNYELIYIIHSNKNVLKLKRLHDFQLAREQIEKVTGIEEFLNDEGDIIEQESRKKTKRTHIEIIQELDTAGQVKNFNYDYLGHLRKIRAKNVTDAMSPDQYEPFQEARCASFHSSIDGFSKFEQWVNPKKEYKILDSGLEVLSFIAYETVADIVDAVLLVRQKSSTGQRSLQLGNGVSIQWPMGLMEVHEALTDYFTPRVWLNNAFYKKMGLEYLFND